MSEFRRDPILGEWVIIAPERARRPSDYLSPDLPSNGALCPFCEGNEHLTPPEIAAVRRSGTAPDGPGWQVRVVPNRFPALRVERQLLSHPYGIFDVMAGVGAHEVIIESPDHIRSPASLSEQHIRSIVRIYRDRITDLSRDPRLKHVVIFKNVGAVAGASLYHTHSQLIALPVVPPRMEAEIRGALDYFERRGRCVYCDMVFEELDRDERIVLDLPQIVALCPYASRFPFEVWLLPKPHVSHFETSSDAILEDFATALKLVLVKLEAALEQPAFNFVLHTLPQHQGEAGHYHWHLEILPRLVGIAGFELGSGVHINPAAPETAATFLREAEAEGETNGYRTRMWAETRPK